MARGNFVQGWTRFGSSLQQFVEGTTKAGQKIGPLTDIYQEIVEPERLVFTSAVLDAKG